jgi:hypothetical protein
MNFQIGELVRGTNNSRTHCPYLVTDVLSDGRIELVWTHDWVMFNDKTLLPFAIYPHKVNLEKVSRLEFAHILAESICDML